MALPAKDSPRFENGFHVYHRTPVRFESDRFEHIGHYTSKEQVNDNHDTDSEKIIVRRVES